MKKLGFLCAARCLIPAGTINLCLRCQQEPHLLLTSFIWTLREYTIIPIMERRQLNNIISLHKELDSTPDINYFCLLSTWMTGPLWSQISSMVQQWTWQSQSSVKLKLSDTVVAIIYHNFFSWCKLCRCCVPSLKSDTCRGQTWWQVIHLKLLSLIYK